MTKRKFAESSKEEKNDRYEEDDVPPLFDKGSGQPVLKVQEMGDLLARVFERPHSDWTEAEKK